MNPDTGFDGPWALNQARLAVGGIPGGLSFQTAPAWWDVPEDEHPATLRRMLDQAWAYLEEGKLAASENLNLHILATCTRRLGEEHVGTLESMHSLANTYFKQGRLVQSEQLLLEVLSIAKRRVSDEHVNTLGSMHNLANTYFEQGRLVEAEQLYLQVLSIRKRRLGDEHVDTLGSMHNLASTYYKQGRLVESEQLHLQVLSIRKRRLGDEHVDTLSSMHNLATTYSKQERLVESEQLCLQVLSIVKHGLGDEHVDTLNSMHNLANTYYKQGRLVESEQLYLQVLSIRKRRLSDEHVDTLHSMQNLANTYSAQGRLVESEQLHLETLSIRKRRLGDEHVDTLRSMHYLAATYSEQGRLAESEQLHLQTLSIRKNRLGDEHVDTLHSMDWLAIIYYKQGRLVESEQLYLQVLPNRKRRLGDQHVDTLNSMHGLANTYSAQGRLVESEQLFLQVLSIRTRRLGDEHVDTLNSMDCLAITYYKQGRLVESEQLYLQVLPIRQRRLGHQHVDTLNSMRNLAAIWNSSRRKGPEQNPFSEMYLQGGHGTQPNHISHDESFGPPGASLTQPVGLDTAYHRKTLPDITAQTSVLDAFGHLVRHGCTDLTSQLDPPRDSEAALSGGRFGDVWCGSLHDRTRVAIKCLRLHTVDEVSSKAIKHAARELHLWSKLKHDNVLELLGFAMFQEQLAMISPWMENGTLNEYLRKRPELDRWLLCLQISEGLEYIHGIGMVHGDLKASNILVSADGIVKLGDFGNSVMANYSIAFSATSVAGGGTARWMAPELIKREDGTAADRSMPADIYAFGMTILEVVTGRKPYSEFRSEPGATLAAMRGKHPRRPGELSEGNRFGNERWEVMVGCWSMEPDNRPTAGFVKAVMSHLL